MSLVWIVDDDQSIRWVLQKAVTREGLHCELFSSVVEVLDRLQYETPQVLVSDIHMPGRSGLELLKTIRERCPHLPVIIMTAYSDLDSAVSAFQGGAFDYLAKPFDIQTALDLILRAAAQSQSEKMIDDVESATPEILGQAPAMQDVFRAIGRLSQSNVTVLVTGESGSGKELVACALHRHSPRCNQPFIALNTAAIPKDLLESELFGHERGSFTGAAAQRRGRFEQAEGGTLFLDEIGDMPFDLQTRLLRVLSDGHFYRVGGQTPIRANVRVIAATHQNLEERVKKGLFREDLYHRLNVIQLRLPALRERPEDIPLLAKHFLSSFAKELGVETKRLSASALKFLMLFDFPGNVRQLENICRWITVMAPAQWVEIRDLPPEVRQDLMATKGAEVLVQAEASVNQNNTFSAVAEQHVSRENMGASSTYQAHVAQTTHVENAPSLPASPPVVHLPNLHRAEPLGPNYDVMPTQPVSHAKWLEFLAQEARRALGEQEVKIMDRFMAQLETVLIQEALKSTQGKRIEAAVRLGIGRNTITRKIQELDIDVSEV